MVYDDYARELIVGCEAFIEKFGNDGTPPPIRPSSPSAYQQILYGLRLCVYVVRHCVTSGGGGTFNHAALTNRNIADQHPITAISGLAAELADQAAALAQKLKKNQGAVNVGKWLSIDETGKIILVPAPSSIAFAGPYASVADLPVPGETNIVYLVGSAAPYQMYAWIDAGYTLIGSTDIDLSDYYTKEETDAGFLKRIDDGAGIYAYVHQGEIQGQIPITQSAVPNTIAGYKPDGNLSVKAAYAGEDAVNLDTMTARALLKAGGTMTGTLILKGAPTQDLEAATKKYVDDNSGGGGTMDHSQLNNRSLPDQHPIAAITGLETEIADLQSTLTMLQNYIVELYDYDVELYNDINELQAEVEALAAEIAGLTGTMDHSQLINRDMADQHPIAAITGLDDFTKV